METETNTTIVHSHLFSSREEYIAFRTAWSKLAKEKKLTSAMILFYNVVRGKDTNRGFTPIQRPSKLSNGASPDQAFKAALSQIIYLATQGGKWADDSRREFVSKFDGTITESFILGEINNQLAKPK